MPSEIKVLSTTAMKTSLDDLAPQFERATGHTIVPSYAPSAQIAKRVADGESSDVAVVTAEGIENLIKQGKVVSGSRADIARSLIGVAVQKGAASRIFRRPTNSARRCWRQNRSP